MKHKHKWGQPRITHCSGTQDEESQCVCGATRLQRFLVAGQSGNCGEVVISAGCTERNTMKFRDISRAGKWRK